MKFTDLEIAAYSVVKLSAYQGNVPVSTGTGFFIRFLIGEDRQSFLIVTNKHVIENASEVHVVCHIAADNTPSGKMINCIVPTNGHNVIMHPSADIDLCAINFNSVVEDANSKGLTLFFCYLSPSLIPHDEQWQHFDAMEDITMIGCPRGIYDEVNNLPIFRKGITASMLSRKYNGRDEFLVDIACFPGSSGSPIVLYDQTGYFDKKENSYKFGVSRIYLIGILYAGPLISNTGQLLMGQVPEIAVNTTMHLGNAIRSSAIFALEHEILQRISDH